ncbi:hypothetical protein RchiOBHm_Chr6g0280691 [Rosa chinensis]|uniref:Uncharacterized protein n=1 Tax=Rosa chinensis TaxID=74649 RepID=A0A2P6PTB8_ROSCH|nr:hypothetical protein RchiOBHm_Chr6g0280691 [Rosa chinensis]
MARSTPERKASDSAIAADEQVAGIAEPPREDPKWSLIMTPSPAEFGATQAASQLTSVKPGGGAIQLQ